MSKEKKPAEADSVSVMEALAQQRSQLEEREAEQYRQDDKQVIRMVSTGRERRRERRNEDAIIRAVDRRKARGNGNDVSVQIKRQAPGMKVRVDVPKEKAPFTAADFFSCGTFIIMATMFVIKILEVI